MSSLKLSPFSPSIRSSDAKARADEFTYYLSRRLGLSSPLPTRQPEPLRRGSWMHRHFKSFLDPLTAADHPSNTSLTAAMNASLDTRLREIRKACQGFGCGQTEIDLNVQTERRDADTTLAWFVASLGVRSSKPGSPLKDGWATWLTAQGRVIATEYVLGCRTDFSPRNLIVVQPDALFFRETDRTLWFVDLKSTSRPAGEHAQGFSIAYQTRLTLLIARLMLPELIAHFALPPDTTIGGVHHLVLQCPSIEFGQNDRPYRYESDGKRSGITGIIVKGPGGWQVSCNGQPHSNPFPFEEAAVELLHSLTGKAPTRTYSGEPDPALYLTRCNDWYAGRGAFAARAVDWDASPPIQTVTTPNLALDADAYEECIAITTQIGKLASRRPYPSNFPRMTPDLTSPLYALPFPAPPPRPAAPPPTPLLVLPREEPHWSASRIILEPAKDSLR